MKRKGFSTIFVLAAIAIIGSMSYIAYKTINSSTKESGAYTNVRNDLQNIVKAEYNVYSQSMAYIPFGDSDPNTKVSVIGSQKNYEKNVKINNIDVILKTIVSKNEDTNVKLIKCKENQTKPVGFLVELHNNILDKNFYYDSCKGSSYETKSDFQEVEKKYNIVNNLSDILPVNNTADDVDQAAPINSNTGDSSEEDQTEYTADDVCKYPLETQVGIERFKKHFAGKGFMFRFNFFGNMFPFHFSFSLGSNNELCIVNDTIKDKIKEVAENSEVNNINLSDADFLNYFQIPASDDYAKNVKKIQDSITKLKDIFNAASLNYVYDWTNDYQHIKTNNDNFYLSESVSNSFFNKSVSFDFYRKYSWNEDKTCSKNFQIDSSNIAVYNWKWETPDESINFNYPASFVSILLDGKMCSLNVKFKNVKDDIDGDGINDFNKNVIYNDNSNDCLKNKEFTYDSLNSYLVGQMDKIKSNLTLQLYETAYKPEINYLYHCSAGFKTCNVIESFINKLNSENTLDLEDKLYSKYKDKYSNKTDIENELKKVYDLLKALRDKAQNKAETLVSTLQNDMNQECNPLTTWDKVDYNNLDIEQTTDNDAVISKNIRACGKDAINFIRENICNVDKHINEIHSGCHKFKFNFCNMFKFKMEMPDVDLWFIPNPDLRTKMDDIINQDKDIEITF